MKGQLKAYLIAIVIILLFVICTKSCGESSSGSGRTIGKCWVCGQSGSFKLDGSYYCFKHYNQRMSGRIG